MRTASQADEVTRERSAPRRRRWLRGAAASAAAAVVALAACSRVPLPMRLAGLHRNRVWTGVSAARLVSAMHGRPVAPANSVVADYGGRGELRVYLSTFADAASAYRAFDAMMRAIRDAASPFGQPREQADSPGRWVIYGPGGHNMLWVSRAQLFWLQGSPEAVQGAAAELPSPSQGTWT